VLPGAREHRRELRGKLGAGPGDPGDADEVQEAARALGDPREALGRRRGRGEQHEVEPGRGEHRRDRLGLLERQSGTMAPSTPARAARWANCSQPIATIGFA